MRLKEIKKYWGLFALLFMNAPQQLVVQAAKPFSSAIESFTVHYTGVDIFGDSATIRCPVTASDDDPVVKSIIASVDDSVWRFVCGWLNWLPANAIKNLPEYISSVNQTCPSDAVGKVLNQVVKNFGLAHPTTNLWRGDQVCPAEFAEERKVAAMMGIFLGSITGVCILACCIAACVYFVNYCRRERERVRVDRLQQSLERGYGC